MSKQQVPKQEQKFALGNTPKKNLFICAWEKQQVVSDMGCTSMFITTLSSAKAGREVCDSSSFSKKHVLYFLCVAIQYGIMQNESQQIQIKEMKMFNRLSCQINFIFNICI
jgi:hypothetical protein